ncbi:hypothetical protein BD310DRAFT_299618 [Dichomitus squalens]|uniref:Uncharacterized protein n=1 Tax=Dichomitus squalens TaxID=114155 RepID=A0A4Q9QBI6_9APHY|nr:hypothetical protein BD310DRAFT_299618 [Dichomitus squalens]
MWTSSDPAEHVVDTILDTPASDRSSSCRTADIPVRAPHTHDALLFIYLCSSCFRIVYGIVAKVGSCLIMYWDVCLLPYLALVCPNMIPVSRSSTGSARCDGLHTPNIAQ